MKTLALLLTLLLAGCGTTGYKTLTASGETLKGIGLQFETIAKVYKQGCDLKTIKAVDCESFRKFGLKFKQMYPLAVDVWLASQKAGDPTMQAKTRDVILQLSTELTQMGLVAYTTFGGR